MLKLKANLKMRLSMILAGTILALLVASAPSHAEMSVLPGSYLTKAYLEKIEHPRFDDGRMCEATSMTFTFRGDGKGRMKLPIKPGPTLKCGISVVSGNKIVAGDQWNYELNAGTVQIFEDTGIRQGDSIVVHFGIKR